MNDVLTKQLARINLYALISRIMMKEVDEDFMEKFESDEMILSSFPNYQEWEKPKELSKKKFFQNYSYQLKRSFFQALPLYFLIL